MGVICPLEQFLWMWNVAVRRRTWRNCLGSGATTRVMSLIQVQMCVCPGERGSIVSAWWFELVQRWISNRPVVISACDVLLCSSSINYCLFCLPPGQDLLLADILSRSTSQCTSQCLVAEVRWKVVQIKEVTSEVRGMKALWAVHVSVSSLAWVSLLGARCPAITRPSM